VCIEECFYGEAIVVVLPTLGSLGHQSFFGGDILFSGGGMMTLDIRYLVLVLSGADEFIIIIALTSSLGRRQRRGKGIPNTRDLG
jgi:hypothetical protein